MNESARMRLARRIRLLRTRRGWSQEVLAELSGLNRSYIGAIERGEHNIGLDNIERIARALEVPVDRLLAAEPITVTQSPSRSALPAPDRAAPPPVIIHRSVFMELLDRPGPARGELILVYLERCGVTVRD